MTYERELAAGRSAADAAAAVILDLYARFEAIADAPASITTAADRESQEVILKSLRAAFPGDAFRAEEATPTLAELPHDGPRLWVIDPIDGTRGFARKNGEFSVMVALVESGEPVVGVVLEPATGVCTYATSGGGCWRCDRGGRPVAVRVTATAALAGATLVQSHTNPARGPTPPVQRLKPGAVVETYSAGIKLARVARAEADLYVSTYDVMNDWDLAAGHVLVTEAGGRATTLDGRPLTYGADNPAHAGGLLASNGLLHDAAVAGMRG
ncbi:MAG TPA: inositol monophosphatase family protein [Gemmataceae bacterium]|jgi:3'(2'), 5'-bisphosphate nucleotidase